MNHVNAIRCNDEYQCSHCGKSWDIHEEAPDCKMTLLYCAPFKTVDYFGLKLQITSDHCAIATNAFGIVYSYRNEPSPVGDTWFIDNSSCCYICEVNLHGLDWRETLRKC